MGPHHKCIWCIWFRIFDRLLPFAYVPPLETLNRPIASTPVIGNKRTVTLVSALMHYQFITFTFYYLHLLGFKVMGMVSIKSLDQRSGGKVGLVTL